MEYEIDNEINYTTLQIRSILVWKEMSKKQQKGHRRKTPQGGWEIGLKEPIQKIFLLKLVTISKKWYNSSWSLYRVNSRAYKVRKLKVLVKWETPGGIWMLLRPLSNNSFLSYLSNLLKTRKHIRLKYAQNHSKSTFGSAYF